jgi:NAD(P)-dependent dehydrogenase (short-subunit alcohol dehydrogenase family)
MTPMLENVDSREVLKTFTDATPIQRAGRPEEIVELILFLLSDKSSFMTGSIHSVDGGATA